MKKPTIYLLECSSVPILQQLQVEEALLRVSQENWCVLNSGSSLAIVMGISGKVEELLFADQVVVDQIPVIKRFSGGGTVVVDHNTLFASFIVNQESVGVRCVPDQVHGWTEEFYQNVFATPDFKLRENDYVFGERKFGGNAQYLRKDRWLHHTTFLWEFDSKNMSYLKLPVKAPKYRGGRGHTEFLCRLSQKFADKHLLFKKIRAELAETFEVKTVVMDEVLPLLSMDHRKATKLLEIKRHR